MRRALENAARVVDEVAMTVGDQADVWPLVQGASEWCRGVSRELAALDASNAGGNVELARAGHRCALRYPIEVGEPLCAILLSPRAALEGETWREVDRARDALVRVLDALLFDTRTRTA